MHLSCAICAETIGPSDDLSVTRCGHMFHTACMATWLARVKNCPQCRNRCTTDNMVRLYLNVSLNDTLSEQDSSTMQGQIDTLQINMRELKVQFKNRESELSVLKESQKMARKTIVGLETQLEQKEMLLKSNLEVQKTLKMQNLLIPGLEKRLKEAQAELATVESVQNMLHSTASEVETMLKSEHSARTLSTMVVLMKREVRSRKEKDDNIRKALSCVQSDLQKSRSREAMLLDKITAMESDLSKIQEDARRQRDQVPQKTTQAITPEPPTKSQSTIKTQTTSSPYMKVVASSIGLGALSKNRTRVAPLRSQPSAPRSRSPTNNNGSQFSIFKKPRLTEPLTTIANSNLVFNGVGGTERRDAFASRDMKSAPVAISKSSSTPSIR